MAILTGRHLQKSYGNLNVLKGVNIEVQKSRAARLAAMFNGLAYGTVTARQVQPVSIEVIQIGAVLVVAGDPAGRRLHRRLPEP